MNHRFPSWSQFNYINADNPNAAFEHLCRMLFCEELSLPAPLWQRINQAGLETEPVETDGQFFGFQAKYFNDKINSADIVDSIKKAKEKHPNLSTLYLYCNLAFGNPKKGQAITAAEERIQECAKKCQLALVMRQGTQILDLIAHNDVAYKRFFDSDQIYDKILREEEKREGSFYNYAQNALKTLAHRFHLERKELEVEIIAALQEKNIIIIHGDSGTGKSAIVRTIAETLKASVVVRFRQGQILRNSPEGSLLPTGYSLDDYIASHELEYPHYKKCIVIDSAEHILNTSAIHGILFDIKQFLKHGWKLLFTIREESLSALQNLLLETDYTDTALIHIPEISEIEVSSILSQFNRKLASNRDISFFANLFHLRLLLSSSTNSSVKDIAMNVIKGNQGEPLATLRLRAFLSYTEQVCKLNSYITSARSIEAVGYASLKSDGILLNFDDIGFCWASHDLFIDWGIGMLLEELWEQEPSVEAFLNKTPKFAKGHNLTNWIRKRIDSDNVFASNISEIIISDPKESREYITDLTTALLLSKYFTTFISLYKENILNNRTGLLQLLSKTINSTCRYRIHNEKYAFPIYQHKGECWSHLLNFVLEEYQHIDKYMLKELMNGLFFYTIITGNDASYEKFCRISWHCFKELPFRYSDVFHINALDICEFLITFSSGIITDDLKSINFDNEPEWVNDFQQQLMFHTWRYPNLIHNLHEFIFSTFIPKWLHQYISHVGSHGAYSSLHGLLNPSYDFEYTPASALHTPFYILLKYFHNKGIQHFVYCLQEMQQFIFCNSQYDTFEKIVMYTSETEYTEILASPSLWGAYRGTESPTHASVLHSMLMALEKYLLEDFHNSDEAIDQKETFLINLLSSSQSVCIAGVVSSLILAYPDIYKRTASILCKTVNFLKYDFERCFKEKDAALLNCNTLNDANKEQFYKERQKSDSLEHRQRDLANLSSYLHCSDSKTAQLIQESYDAYHKLHQKDVKFFDTRLMLYAKDPRFLQKEKTPYSEGLVKVTYSLDPIKLPKNIQKYFYKREENKEHQQKIFNLKIWCMSTRGYNSDATLLNYWDEHPSEVFQLARDIEKHPKLYQGEGMPTITSDEVFAALYLRCRDKLSRTILVEVCEIILNSIQSEKVCDPLSAQSDLLWLLPSIVLDVEECRDKATFLLYLKFCELSTRQTRSYEVFNFCKKIHELDLWSIFPTELQHVWDSAYATLTVGNSSPAVKLENMEFLFCLLPNNVMALHHSSSAARILDDIHIYSRIVIRSRWRNFHLPDDFCKKLGEYLISLAPNIVEAKINCISPLIINNTCSGKQILLSILFASKQSETTDAFWKIWNIIYSKLSELDFSERHALEDIITLSDRLFCGVFDFAHLINEFFYLFFEKIIKEEVISQQRIFEAIAFIFSIHCSKISIHTYVLLSKLIEINPHVTPYEGTISQLERMIENTRLKLSEIENKKLYAHMRELLVFMRDNGSNYAHTKLEQSF
ncbi:MAG: ATP-binding protein [Akkermansia sp.]|nr:ATP-binding protein [Akkermansia sp.]